MSDWAVSSVLEKEDFYKLAEICKKEKRSVAFLIREAVHEYVEKHSEE